MVTVQGILDRGDLDAAAFARMFGVPDAALGADVCALIADKDLRYRRLTQAERDAAILRILARLDEQPSSVLDPARRDVWSKAWSAQRARAIAHGFVGQALEPTFVSKEPVLRVGADFAIPASARMELDVYAIVRRFIFRRWAADARAAFEFGCGSAFNLPDLAEMYPGLRICGLDWAAASVQLVNDLARHRGFKLEGRHFDFFEPDESLDFPPGSVVFTFCALEQTGDRFGPFLEYLLRKRPLRCVHLEPIQEFYDPGSLPDWLAIAFHRARQYLSGFRPALKRLADDGVLRIVDERRLGFGSMFHECYGLIVWEPA